MRTHRPRRPVAVLFAAAVLAGGASAAAVATGVGGPEAQAVPPSVVAACPPGQHPYFWDASICQVNCPPGQENTFPALGGDCVPKLCGGRMDQFRGPCYF